MNMVDLLDKLFLGFISVAVPVLMVGMVLLIVYAVYREIRGGS